MPVRCRALSRERKARRLRVWAHRTLGIPRKARLEGTIPAKPSGGRWRKFGAPPTQCKESEFSKTQRPAQNRNGQTSRPLALRACSCQFVNHLWHSCLLWQSLSAVHCGSSGSPSTPMALPSLSGERERLFPVLPRTPRKYSYQIHHLPAGSRPTDRAAPGSNAVVLPTVDKSLCCATVARRDLGVASR